MENQENKKKVKSIRYRIFNYVTLIFIAIAIIWVAVQLMAVTNSKYTDNAQVKRYIAPVNSHVQGYIKEIRFEEYQHVNKGDTLIVLDNSEYILQLAQAEANYANAIAGKNIMGSTINTTHNNISVSDAGVEEVKVRLENATTDLKRYKNLLAQDAVTQDQFDRVKTEYEATKAKYDMLVRQKKSTVLIGEEQIKRLSQNEANIKQAKAALDIAKLNLSYTVITASCNGIVGRKDMHMGQLIQPGQSIVSIVDDDEVWVVANYKEKLTKNISIGDRVEIKVDAVPNTKFIGRVSALSNATGAAFSLIPTDNSTGNFVKTEQLIPVKIELTAENSRENIKLLKSGMSAEVYVKSR
jgi:membrane fusion protein, multidrug efflux system